MIQTLPIISAVHHIRRQHLLLTLLRKDLRIRVFLHTIIKQQGHYESSQQCDKRFAETEIGPQWVLRSHRVIISVPSSTHEVFKVQCLCTPPILFSSGVAAGSLPANDWSTLALNESHENFHQDVVKNLHFQDLINIRKHIVAIFKTRLACPLHTYRANTYVKHICCDHRLILCVLCVPIKASA